MHMYVIKSLLSVSAAGAGLYTMVGGGTAVYTGTYKGLKSGITFAAGAALSSFVGGGTVIYTGTSFIRIVGIVATFNAGGSAFLGSGKENSCFPRLR